MQTKKRLISLIRTGTGLVILAALLMTVLIISVTPAAAAPRVGSVAVGPQVGTLTTGTAGSTTFLITVTKGNNQNLTAGLSVDRGTAGRRYLFVHTFISQFW